MYKKGDRIEIIDGVIEIEDKATGEGYYLAKYVDHWRNDTFVIYIPERRFNDNRKDYPKNQRDQRFCT